MKKLVVLSVCLVALLAVSTVSKADPYEMDIATALQMRHLSTSEGDFASLWFVGTFGGADQLPGDIDIYGSNHMIDQVGFTGVISEGSSLDGVAWARIGLAEPVLSGEFDGFLLPLANDNGDLWQYRAYVIISGGEPVYSNGGAWTSLDHDLSMELFVDLGSVIDFSTVTGIGYDIQWTSALNLGKTGDQYSTSVVPVPGAVLLGLFGISAAGLKLRRFA